jgi:predicted negative regulator of RcsB-dependent stress response
MATSTAPRSRQPRPPLDGEEALSLRAAELAAWARRNVRIIIGVAAVALVLVLGLVMWRMNDAQRSAQAAERLLALRQNPATATAAGASELEAFVQQYRGTREADEARMLLAEARLASGQPREAVAALRPVTQGRSPLRAQAWLMTGAAHAEAGDLAAAVAAYEEASERFDATFQKLEALDAAALLHEDAGDFPAAVALYQRMLGMVEEESMEYGVVQMRMAEASARATAPRP